MNINQMKESKFLKKEDCGKGILVTIDRIEQHNVAMSGQPEELKYCIAFQEDILPMVTNSVNRSLIASIIGSEETDDWHGHQVVLYNDPTVTFGGKVIGGIRVRAPKKQPPRSAPSPAALAAAAPAPAPAPRPAPAPAPAELVVEEDDEVPF